MRETKFKIWNTKNKTMNYDHHSRDLDKADLVFLHGRIISISGENIFLQFTGLKDKNKKEIYEGDIVLLDGEEDMKFKIEFREEIMAFVLRDTHLKGYWKSYEGEELQVIGNIYENPELIKQDGKGELGE